MFWTNFLPVICDVKMNETVLSGCCYYHLLRRWCSHWPLLPDEIQLPDFYYASTIVHMSFSSPPWSSTTVLSPVSNSDFVVHVDHSLYLLQPYLLIGIEIFYGTDDVRVHLLLQWRLP
jgi:hypothetical protein